MPTTVKESKDPLRSQLARFLEWEEGHVGFDKAVDGIPEDQRGSPAAGFEHTAWQLLEHMRLAQKDLLDFCGNPQIRPMLSSGRTITGRGVPRRLVRLPWDESIADFKADREKLKRLIRETDLDLFATVPTGKGQQTYLRAILLVADHNAYHLGQLVAVRRALGIWH